MSCEYTAALALGARGSTRKKLAAAAGCILEYIGQVAVIAGHKRERRQGRDYLEWLLKQKSAWVAPRALSHSCLFLHSYTCIRDRDGLIVE